MTSRRFDAMTPELYARTKALFEVVCELGEAEREQALQRFSVADPATTAAVRRLLGFHDPEFARAEGQMGSEFADSLAQDVNNVRQNTTRTGPLKSRRFHFLRPVPGLSDPRLSGNLFRSCKSGGWLCFALGGLLLGVIFLLAQVELRNQLWVTRSGELTRLANMLEQTLQYELNSHRENLIRLANEPRTRKEIKALLEQESIGRLRIGELARFSQYSDHELMLLKQMTRADEGEIEFVLRDCFGNVVAASVNCSGESAIYSTSALYRADGNHGIWMMIPLENKNGEVQAVLSVNDKSLETELRTLCELASFGRSGNVTAFFGDRECERLASNLGVSFWKPQESPSVIIADDERGVPCLMHVRWLEDYACGFLIKVDKAEALALPATRGQMLLQALLGLFGLAAAIKLVLLTKLYRNRSLIGQMVGPYLILEKIAEGGMGVIYKAHHQMLGRLAAVKVLRKGMLDSQSRKRFDREVRLVSQLRCQHTICIYDYGTSAKGEPYFAMELLDGITLDRAIRTQGPFSEATTLRLFAEVATSLREAHHMGIIHRDLAPQNLMLTTEDVDGRQSMVVIDFGLAKPIGKPDKTLDKRPRHWSGTPGYMAPERIRDPHSADLRSDIFALGAVGFFMLTGHPPFEGNSFEDTFCKTLDGEDFLTEQLPGPTSEPRRAEAASDSRSPDTPDYQNKPANLSVREIIAKCLARDPGGRPQSMDELLDLVQQLQSCSACYIGIPYQVLGVDLGK